MANLSNINNILRISSSGVGLNKDNTGPSELDIESAGADMIDMTRTDLKTYRFAISGSSDFSIFDVAANDDRLTINSGGNATFSGTVTTSDVYGASSLRVAALGGILYLDSSSGASTIMRTNGTTTALTLDNGQNATFAGDVTTVGNVVAGSSITLGASNGRVTALQGIFGSAFCLTSDGKATFGSTSSSIPIALAIDGAGASPALLIATNNNATFAGTVEGTTARFDTLNNKANSANIIYRSGTNTIVGNNGDALVVQDGGKVGVGTTGPIEKFQVRTDTTTDNSFQGINVNNFGTGGTRAGISFKCYDWVQSAIWHGRGASAAYNGALVLGTNPNTSDLTVGGVVGRMWILNNGDVGIATDQPTAKLDINGTVRYRGSIYNQLSYQVTGSYSANTWYDFATSATLTQNGIYILTAYIEDFTAGGGNYYTYVASTNFYWVTTGTNRPTAFNFPPMLGTGHATGVIPSIRVTQELGSSGALSRLQWQSSYTYTNLQNAGGKILRFDLKRIGA